MWLPIRATVADDCSCSSQTEDIELLECLRPLLYTSTATAAVHRATM